MKIFVMGNVTYDITMPIDHYPVENTKNRIHEIVECGGGPSGTAAYLLGKWGADTHIAGIIGNDLYGQNLLKEYEIVNVNTKYLEVNNNHITSSAFILANRENGSRTVFSYKPTDMKMNPFILDFKPDIILIDGQEYERSLEVLNQFPDAISIIDAGRDRKEIVELSKKVTWLVCSREFAEKVTSLKVNYDDLNTLSEIYKKMKEIFKNNIVITLEAKGCYYEYEIIPSIQVKAIDSTGAGDIFHGAFTYYLSKGYDINKILKLSNIAGAISVTRVGTRHSIPTLEEMEYVYNEFK